MQRDCSGRPLRLFLTFYRPHRRLFALDLLFSLLSCLADLAFPYVSRQAMQNLLPLGLFRTFFAIMAALLAAYLLKAVFKYAVTVIGHQCGVLIEADMRQELFEHLQTMSFRFFDCNRTGVLMSRMTSDLFSITELAHHGPEYLLTAVVTLGGALAILAPICWQLALVLLLLVPLSLWITIRQRKRMNDANVAVKRRQAEINTVIESGISGVRTAKAFTNEAVEREKFLACNDRYKHSKTDWYRAMGVFQGGMEFTMSAMQVVVIALGGAYIMRGQIDYIDLITFSLYVTTFISPIRTLVNFMEVFTDGTAGFQRFLELMRVQPDIADAPDARPLPPVRGQVDYNDVSFDYAEGATVLSHVDLHIAPGETLAVVGPSGGGKTTLCQLLPRFYDVTSGSVCIDGIDVRTVTQASLRRCVGVLQQEVFLFADTIRENIRYGRPDATDAEVEAAAKAARCDHFIHTLAGGYDFVINEEGTNLSQGQRQLVTIARAILADRPALILDEATSNVDTRTEELIQRAMDELMRGRTSFVIAHRLSTIRNADVILVLRDGDIVEKGTHKELLAKGGFYAELYNSQFEDAA